MNAHIFQQWVFQWTVLILWNYMSLWDYGEIFWKAELVFSLEAENNDNTAPNHNQTHNHKYIKWSEKQLCRCSKLFCTFLCRCFERLQRETSRNFLVTRFMEEMSYVFSFTFFSLPLLFTLHWWPLAFLIWHRREMVANLSCSDKQIGISGRG